MGISSTSSTKSTQKIQDWNTFVDGHRDGKTATVPEKHVLRLLLSDGGKDDHLSLLLFEAILHYQSCRTTFNKPR
ncbi:hypothetical protein P8452_32638 [Trifolium repens]|nr:hypothetical protein P8452_32638 [Trifolium repens]